MNKPSVSKLINGTKRFMSKHSPEILVTIGVGGMITTTILAVKATPKALQLIEAKKKEEHKDKLTPVEVVKTTWKCYVPAVVTGVTSTACIIGASSVHAKRNAALATAYKLSETALSDYREKVVETLGEKKEQAVQEKVSEKYVNHAPVNQNDVIVTEYGSTWCFDPMSGRTFTTSIDRIQKAENELNKRMLHDTFGYVTLNEFYDELGLDRTEVGEILGWNTNAMIDISIDTKLDERRGEPMLVLYYRNRPTYEFERF